MKTYEIELEGSTNLLLNRYSNELNKEKQAVAREKIPEWEEKNWHRKAYYDKAKKLILPDTYITGSLRTGAFASGVQLSKRKGSKSISKKFIDGNLLIEESPLINSATGLLPFDCNVKIGQATVMSIRPMIEKGWTATFRIIDLNESFSKEELERLIDYCGKFIGLGDWRPKYGRYSIRKIKEVN